MVLRTRTGTVSGRQIAGWHAFTAAAIRGDASQTSDVHKDRSREIRKHLAQLPHFVSRGAQKNFLEFTVRLKERGAQVIVDEHYFQRIVAKAILFRRTEKLVQEQQYGGYRANVVTYTLAWLSYRTAQRIDLDTIWRDQKLSTAMEKSIFALSRTVNAHITNAPGGGNITEWCKKEECWNKLRDISVELPTSLEAELIPLGSSISVRVAVVDRGIEALTADERQMVNEIMAVPSDAWFRISNWAKETHNLQGWQRSLAYSIGKLVGRGKEPSRKQAIQAVKS